MTDAPDATDPLVADLLAFIAASPSPYHAAAEGARRLEAAGFSRRQGTDDVVGNGYVLDGGLLIAWRGAHVATDAPRRIIGAHTDSPNLRIKPRPDLGGSGVSRLAAEPYGGALLNSWLDRDLGLSGRVAVLADGAVDERLVRVDRPLLRVPQLAIHLDREVSTSGLLLDRQRHLHPLWALGEPSPGDFVAWLADAIDVDPDAVVAWDLMTHDLTAPGLLGRDDELIAAPRLDNLCSCWGALRALTGAATDAVAVVALFDHEEIGSGTATGAESPRLGELLARLDAAAGHSADTAAAVRDRSRILSADMAHATHPNYPERHEPSHPITLGGGPVVKTNVNGRYATDARTAAEFVAACRSVGVPTQTYAHRADLACGSTIGPISAAGLGIATVDVGMPQLSMHSARELMAAADVGHMVRSFSAWLAG